MYGAILGDMIGAPYEFDRGEKTKDFPLFVKESQFTDDTVMTIAVAEAFYGLSDEMKKECRRRLNKDMLALLDRFTEKIGRKFQSGKSND